MTQPNSFHAQHNYLVYLLEFPGIFFETLSGGGMTSETSTVDPGDGSPNVVITGPSRVEQVTVGKAYDPTRDAPLDAWSAAWQRGQQRRLTLVKQPVTPEGVPTGARTTFMRCSRVSYQTPDVQKGSAEAARLEIVLHPEDVL